MNKTKNNILDKQKIKKLTRRIRPQFGILPIVIVIAAAAALMIMTWLIRDVLQVKHIYAAAGFELIGIVAVLICLLIPFSVVLYRRRVREVLTLSQAIQRVADGDFKSRIPSDKKNRLIPMYEDFNKMCDELESVQMLRNDFINNYSHEFKTPIASINGFAELLLAKKDLTKAEQHQYLEIIVDESARLSKLATNTILLSRLSSQHIVTDIETYDLGEQIRQCSILLSPKWMEKEQDFEGELIHVPFRGNKEMLQHMWINLMDNAIKYTPEGGKIVVRNYVENDCVIVEITDTGQGISEDIREHLFDPYFQGDSSHSHQGLGLGLSIVIRIVELCKGGITVDSHVGQGSTFKVSLPIDNMDAQK